MLQHFEAPTLTQALRRARCTAGPSAVVVDVRRHAAGDGARVVVAVDTEAGPARLLRERGVTPERSRMLLEGLERLPAAQREAGLRARLERLLRVQPRDAPASTVGPRVLALVGPTGVGKTTTVAKIAGQALLRRQQRVGLITLDLYRVAAVDQLRAYAELLGAPLEVAANPGELQQAVQRLWHCDLVLIDTAGRSPLDRRRLGELATLLGCLPNARNFLVLAANARLAEMEDAIRRFRPCWVDGLVLTKLDEALLAGDVLELLARSPLPLRYTCAGQEVPDDLQDASAPPLVDWILTPPEEAWA